jgi:aminopeptidase N
MAKDPAPIAIRLEDYRQPDFRLQKVELHFDLRENSTRVKSKMTMERNLAQDSSRLAPLVLNGEKLKLLSVAIDGQKLSATQYTVDEDFLKIATPGEKFVLETEVELEPDKNLACEGLYKSSGMFCTQCEAESFRRISYMLDRPDVMSIYTVTIDADKSKYPILLSNGNAVERKDLGEGRHRVVWQDPFKKPAYLFALVAGDLAVLEDTFKTRSGRDVKLQIFARHGLQDRCQHAMDSLKWSMKWDEDVYGLEYDLDIFMIVVAEDFNMGAMENKGLNIFNANYILAKPQTATDSDYDAITAVVGHEYFHNWTGNRITCRDWFQLSLKEGLTVFRDQRFSADLASAAVNRIEDVIRLRTHQFAEDAGPLAHPVRPRSYISIDNFYTLTVYEKGAEVIRMIETIVGRDGFRKGMDLYFKRHDGQAVTTEDFVAAMADANKVDLNQFKNWYDQAGTPTIKVTTDYQAKDSTFKVTVEQKCPPTPGQTEKNPYHIPVAVGLLGRKSTGPSYDLPLHLRGVSSSTAMKTAILEVKERRQSFTFENLNEKPVLSLLRNFSAPVRVEYEASDDDLAFQIAHDSDSFARWEAAQTLTVRIVKELVAEDRAGHRLHDAEKLVKAFGPILENSSEDPAFAALILTLPAEQYLAQFFDVIDVDAIFLSREHIMRSIERAHRPALIKLYTELTAEGTQGLGALAAGRRALRNRVLAYLTLSNQKEDLDLALMQMTTAQNMTDEIGALMALSFSESVQRHEGLTKFYKKWSDEPLVINKWLTIQAVAPTPDTLDNVIRLSRGTAFDKTNPNKIFALLVAFSRMNNVRFHEISGEGYQFIADQVLDIDSRNPQVAARLVGAFNQWKSFDQERQGLMKIQLERMIAHPKLSPNVFEIVSKTLKG